MFLSMSQIFYRVVQRPVSPTRKVRRRPVANRCMTNNDTLSATQVRPYFYVTDYLGSVRMTVDGVTGGVEQSLEYLPSGYVCHSENYGAQPYKFCGKELMTMHGFDQYDSEARFQHDYLPRFTQMDPLAEWDYATSPYAYCQNDFVNLADPTGMSPVYHKSGRFLGTTKEGFTGMVLIYSGNTNVPWHELSEDFVYNYLYDYVSSFDFAVQTNMIDDRGMVKVWNHILSRFEGLGDITSHPYRNFVTVLKRMFK